MHALAYVACFRRPFDSRHIRSSSCCVCPRHCVDIVLMWSLLSLAFQPVHTTVDAHALVLAIATVAWLLLRLLLMLMLLLSLQLLLQSQSHLSAEVAVVVAGGCASVPIPYRRLLCRVFVRGLGQAGAHIRLSQVALSLLHTRAQRTRINTCTRLSIQLPRHLLLRCTLPLLWCT